MSGFLYELRLPLGRNYLTFQVLDHERTWRTFHSADHLVCSPLVRRARRLSTFAASS